MPTILPTDGLPDSERGEPASTGLGVPATNDLVPGLRPAPPNRPGAAESVAPGPASCRECSAEIPPLPVNTSGICEACWLNHMTAMGWIGVDGVFRTTRDTRGRSIW